MHELGQAKVKDLDAPVFGDEEVLRFEVAMDDALLVRCRQAMSDLNPEVDGLADRQWAALKQLPQGIALE